MTTTRKTEGGLFDTEHNRLAFTIGDEAIPVMISVMDEGDDLVELCRPIGIERVDDGIERFRKATDLEAVFGTGDIVPPRLAIDFRKPIPSQVADWLREFAQQLETAADRIELVEDDRVLLPEAGVFTRQEWAKIIGVSTGTMERTLNSIGITTADVDAADYWDRMLKLADETAAA